MKKLLLLVTICLMVGIATAQNTPLGGGGGGAFGGDAQCQPTGPVACQNDPYNCGSIGNVCTGLGAACVNGSCWSCLVAGVGCHASIQPLQPMNFKSSDIRASLVKFRRHPAIKRQL